jgi:hypothetical protein
MTTTRVVPRWMRNLLAGRMPPRWRRRRRRRRTSPRSQNDDYAIRTR